MIDRYSRRRVVPSGPIGIAVSVAVAPFAALIRAVRGPGVVSPVAETNVVAHSYCTGPDVTDTDGAVVGGASVSRTISTAPPTGPTVVVPVAVPKTTAY